MKIITYNINGIRAALSKDLNGWLASTNTDIICFQEVKANTAQFDETIFTQLGFHCYWHNAEKKGYSGVAILSKIKPKHVTYGCGISEIDAEGRILRADFDAFSVMSVYFPSGSSGEERQSFKMDFLDKFYTYIQELKKSFPKLIICGDFNICHQAMDIHNPISNKNSSGFLPEERQWLSKFLDSGFVDSFRYLNPNLQQYSWWSYRFNARTKNLGWRIDYNLISNPLLQQITRANILSQAVHSDHCPVLLEITD